MYCTKCGKEISDSTKFCMYCGAPVGNGASPQPETTTTSYNPGVSSEYQNKLRMFIGKNAEYYLRRFQEISVKNSKASWNWAAFFLSTYWCFLEKIKPKSDYPLKTLYPRAFQTGQNHLIYYDFTTVE